MKRVILPQPPNPDDSAYRGNPLLYNRALFRWAGEVKGKLEQSSQVNDTPLDQAFVLGSYTLTTSIAGTATGTQVTNFVLSVLDSMQRKGIISPKTQGGNT